MEMQLATLLCPQTGLSCICPISFYLENHEENGVNRKQPWNPALCFSFLPLQARPLLPGPLPSPKKKKKELVKQAPFWLARPFVWQRGAHQAGWAQSSCSPRRVFSGEKSGEVEGLRGAVGRGGGPDLYPSSARLAFHQLRLLRAPS